MFLFRFSSRDKHESCLSIAKIVSVHVSAPVVLSIFPGNYSMIVFDLACSCGFSFEGWFQDHQDFDNQQRNSLLECPECGSHEIKKILSPVRFQSAGRDVEPPLQQNGTEAVSREDAEKALATLQKFVIKNFEDVGADLAKESLKIHYGFSEPRNIRGVTTEAEEKQLSEEGINLIKIPIPVRNEGVN